jgi:5-carboxyvanillate decarboxylase
MDARLKEMEQAEVDLSVLSLNPPGVQIYDDTRKAVSLVQDMNDRLAEIVQSRSGRFGGLGSLAPQDPKRSADEVKRIMGPLGLGVLIASFPNCRIKLRGVSAADIAAFEAMLVSFENGLQEKTLRPNRQRG